VNASTWYERGVAGLISVLHPKTLGKTIATEYRGLDKVVRKGHQFLNAADRAELRATNPTKHEEVTMRRRWTMGLFVFLWTTVLVYAIVQPWYWAALFIWVHVATLFFIGYTDPVMTEVQTKRMAGESFIRRIFEEVTIPASERKKETPPVVAIVDPPARLSRGTGYTVTVRIPSEGDASKALSPAGVGTLAQKMQKDKLTTFTQSVAGDDSLVRLLSLDRDPWSLPPTSNPLVVAPRQIDLWEYECDLGVLADSSPWLARLVEEGDGGGWIVGGAPRKGKTIFLSNLIVPIMLDPMAELHMIDGKAVDFAPVERVAKTFIANPNYSDLQLLRLATQHVKAQQKEINRRRQLMFGKYAKLSGPVARKLNLTTEWTVIDEMAVITSDLLKKHKDEVEDFLDILLSNVKMGPAFGVFCILASQRPSSKVIPVDLRDMVIRRTAFYIAGVSGSQAILGKAGPMYRADWLDPDQKGVSITVGVGRTRCHLVGLEELERVASAAVSLRAAHRPSNVIPMGSRYPEPVGTVLRAFTRAEADVLPTARLIELLHEDGLTSVNGKNLADSLKPFGIEPGRPYIGAKQVRGYLKAQFENVPQVPELDQSSPGFESEGDDTDEGPEDGSGLIAANRE